MTYITKTAIEVIEYVKSKGRSCDPSHIIEVLIILHLVSQALKSASLQKTHSVPISSTSSPFIRPLIRSVSTVLVLRILSDALTPDKCMTSSEP